MTNFETELKPDNLKLIREIAGGVSAELKALAAAEAEVERQRSLIAKKIEEQVNKLDLAIDEDGDDAEDLEDELRDELADLASVLGMTWNGDWDCGYGWSPGDKVEFWVPSTC